MATYILDTSIILGYLRGSKYADYIEQHFAVSLPPNIGLISIVTIGELYSLALQLGWSNEKRNKLSDLLKIIPSVDISNDLIIEKYAEIDSFSQSKNPLKKLPTGMSARYMGKNDVWIAATGSVVNAILLTTDKDFNHLNGEYLTVVYIDPGLK